MDVRVGAGPGVGDCADAHSEDEVDDSVRLVEVRDLDGPNLFLLEPAIKLEIQREPGSQLSSERHAAISSLLQVVDLPWAIDAALPTIVDHLRARLWPGVQLQPASTRQMDDPTFLAVAFPWQWRGASVALAETAVALLSGATTEDPEPALRAALERDHAHNDVPEWLRANEVHIPIAGITGTNGKTTTTRLLAHIARTAGHHVGWTTTAGVFIDGELVLEGDYTGPSGARRVLDEPDVTLAVLETARGGLLLRGLAYAQNDVSIFLNISPDHLDMQGVQTVETLAEVKSIVVRVTKPDGVVVLNADDPLVRAWASRVAPTVLLFSTQPSSQVIDDHLAAGGRAVIVRDGALWLCTGAAREQIAPLSAIPMTWGGRAAHNVENAAAATGGALGLGFDLTTIREGLATFRSDATSNRGRLNVYRRGAQAVVIDYAHNESGLIALLHFGRALLGTEGTLHAIIGTAGDRNDEVMVNLGRVAADGAECVYIKNNPRYLRGRPLGEASGLMLDGAHTVRNDASVSGPFEGELAAFDAALSAMGPHDALVVMCLEEQDEILERMRATGWEEWTDAASG